MKQKVFALLLALMLVSALPVSALATETTPEVLETMEPDMAVSEQYIQIPIDKGSREIDLMQDVVLENDFDLPGDVFVRFNGHTITVPSGKTLTVNGQLGSWWEMGGIIVESGGRLVNQGYIGTAGILDIRGSYEGGYITTSYSTSSVINGIPNSKIWMIYVVDKGDPNADHTDLFLESLNRINSTNYGHYSLLLHGNLILPCDLVIPENVLFCLENNALTLTIPAGRKITNYGEIRTYENQTVLNYGVVENAGYMNIQGPWLGNQPVKAKMTQDQLEAAIAAAAGKGEQYILEKDFTLERDLVIDGTDVGLYINGSLTVPKGMTLTIGNGGYITVGENGTLDVQGEIKVNYTNDWPCRVNMFYWNGKVSTVKGVPQEYIVMNCPVSNEAELVNALEYLSGKTFGFQIVRVNNSITLTRDITVPKNTCLRLQNGAILTIPAGRTFTHNGAEIQLNEGHAIRNNGVIENNSDFYISGTGKMVNNGTFKNNGKLYMNGVWEGNDAVQMKMTQAQLEAAIAAAAGKGEQYILEKDFTLERDLVIDGTDVGLYINGSLTVPKGMTLTIGNGGYITVGENGTLDVQGEIKVNYTNDWPCRVNMFYWNGKVSTVKGVPQEYIVMNCPVSNEAELVNALEYLSGKTFGFQIVRVNNSITLTRDITVPKNTCLRLQNGAILTIPAGRTFTHNGAEIQLNEGHAIRNNGVIENNSDFYISGTGKMVNNGTFKNNGKLYMNGVWEGNAPVTPHTHTYTEEVTPPTCTEQGYTTFTCECGDSYQGKFEPAKKHKFQEGICTVCGEEDPDYVKPAADRIAGGNRISTALTTSDKLKQVLGVEKYDTIVVADAMSFPDALSGSYLAAATKAPILLYKEGQASVVNYIRENLNEGGKVYILGGTSSVPDSLMTELSGIDCERVAGSGRLATSLKIIAKADELRGTKPEKVLICDGRGFADSLSASATGLPILLVNGGGSLNDEQKAYLESVRGAELYVIGGKNSVSEDILIALNAYDADGAERVAGGGRELTSVEVAKKFFPGATSAALASSTSFPDGLSGGPVAYAMGAPLLLTRDTKETITASYVNSNGITDGYIIGGEAAVSNASAAIVFGKE